MSGWSQTLRANAGTLRGLAERLESEPLRSVYTALDEVWIGPAATELASGGQAHDRAAASVGQELRRIAGSLDQRAYQIEAAERAAAEAASLAEPAMAPDTAAPASPPATTPSRLPPSWH